MIQKAVRMVCLVCAVIGALSCAKRRTLEVVNTSGRRQAVMVFNQSLADLYWIDSVDVGRSACWHIPEFARDEHVVVVIAAVMTESEITGILPRPTTWTDSVVLDRSWSFRIHGPTNAAPLDRHESPTC